MVLIGFTIKILNPIIIFKYTGIPNEVLKVYM